MILQRNMRFTSNKSARKRLLIYCKGKACLANDLFVMFTFISTSYISLFSNGCKHAWQVRRLAEDVYKSNRIHVYSLSNGSTWQKILRRETSHDEKAVFITPFKRDIMPDISIRYATKYIKLVT